jgi:hypothetical protein
MTLEKLFRLKYELLARAENHRDLPEMSDDEVRAFHRGFDAALEAFFREALPELLEPEPGKKSA